MLLLQLTGYARQTNLGAALDSASTYIWRVTQTQTAWTTPMRELFVVRNYSISIEITLHVKFN